MKKKLQPLVSFNNEYYTYPNSITCGYWGCYLLENDLDCYKLQTREKWLSHIRELRSSSFHRIVLEYFPYNQHLKDFNKCMRKHGIFSRYFFSKNIHQIMLAQFIECPLDHYTISRTFDKSHGYSPIQNRSQYQTLSMIESYIFDQLFLEFHDNHILYQKLIQWFDLYRNPRKCKICGSWYRLIDIPQWVYSGSNGYKDCCFKCSIMASPKKKELNTLIPEFIAKCGFIPKTDASLINYNFTKNICYENWHYVAKQYGMMGGISHVKKKFGSWFTALVKLEIIPNEVRETPYGIRCLAKDGHECRSLDEKIIDDWFFDKKIRHSREPLYPEDPELNKYHRHRADWKIGDSYVEYFGLVGNEKYDEKILRKKSLAMKHHLHLIEIYPQDLKNLDSKLRVLLQI